MAENTRNPSVDILRGIAMLMVVLGHTISGSTVDYENTFLFNIIWTLQMPLFMLISGYVTKFSRKITSSKGLWQYVCKRTIAYLLPWIVWTLIVRGLIFRQTGYLDIKHLVYNMDSGYWFLFSLWTIAMIFGVSQLIGEKLGFKNRWTKLLVVTVVYVLGMVVLGGIGLAMGLSFLCIKLTLYYMPFFFAGYFWGQLQPDVEKLKAGKKLIEVCVAACLVVWIALMQRYNFYTISDNGFGIILRAVTSLSGCVAICGLVVPLVSNFSKNRGGVLLQYVGIHSLEVYLIHYLLLSILKTAEMSALITVTGFVVMSVNYVLTVGATVVVVWMVNSNRLLARVLFGKNG